MEITLLGRASFLIGTPGGVVAVTDCSGYNRMLAHDIVTMNCPH